MATVRLNDDQRRAVDNLDDNLLVSAGAGCGKTATLVERFVNVLAQGRGEVGDIVAITFTEKAANELKERVHARLGELHADAPDDEKKRFWKGHLTQAEAAHISTIHSFCTEILREYPIQAGVDPAFTVVEQRESDLLVEAAVRTVLVRELERSLDEASFLLSRVLYPQLEEVVRETLARAESFRETLLSLCSEGSTAEEIAESMRRRLIDMGAARAVEVFSTPGISAAVALLEATSGKSTDKLEMLRREMLAAYEGWRVAEAEAAGPHILGIAGFTKPGRTGKADAWDGDVKEVREALGCMIEAAREAARLFEAAESAEGLDLAARSLLVVGRFHELAMAEYRAAKRERGLVDFDDLLGVTRDLLRDHGDIAEALAGRYRYIMVDEFQDTDSLQAQIIRTVASRGANLFLVGDAEQSIYRFRGAEVEVFRQATVEFGRRQASRVEELTGNYRSRPHLIGFLNHLFCAISPEGELPLWKTSHMPLLPRVAGGGGDVEILFAASDVGIDEARRIEAASLVRRIIEIVAKGQVPVRETGAAGEAVERPPCYGDVAILLRSMSSVEVYEQALAEAGVAYTTVAGSTFYRRQEIKDVINLLRFLVDGSDSLSLLGALRSPLFALCDDALAILAGKAGLADYFKGAQTPEMLNLRDRDALERAVVVVKRLKEIANRVPVRRLLDELFDRTGYPAALAAQFHGRQKVLNIVKFRDSAGQFDARGGSSLQSFVAAASDLEGRGERESEAVGLEEGESLAVRIMTIHAAKGLEFPIVIVADACREPNTQGAGGLLADPELGASVMKLGPECEPLRRVIRDRRKERESAERCRLFYVAATRARDHLIISGAAKKPRGWLAETLEALAIDADDFGRHVFDGFCVEYIAADRPGAKSAGRRGRGLAKLAERIIAGEAITLEMAREAPPPLVAPVGEGSRGVGFVSATAVGDFARCPLRYELVHLRGVPADYVLSSRRGGKIPGHVLGTVLHETLERVRADESLAFALDRVIASRGRYRAIADRLKREASSVLARFEASASCARIEALGGKRELSFAFEFEGVCLEGKIDRLADGEIIDFKSDDVPAGGARDRAEKYRPQMDVYALAAGRLAGKVPERVTVSFLRTAEEVSWEYGEKGVVAAAARLRVILEGLRRGAPFEAVRSGSCRCEYGSVCELIAGSRPSRS